MAVAQMNVRMDKELKETGDFALSQVGYTPTRAVHALWQFARDNIGDLGRVQSVLDGLRGEKQEASATASAYWEDAAAAQKLRDEFYRKIGIEPPEPFRLAPGESYEDALQRQIELDRINLDLAYEERNAERGL